MRNIIKNIRIQSENASTNIAWTSIFIAIAMIFYSIFK